MTGLISSTSTPISLGPLRSADRARWEELARGYHAFYGESFPGSTYDATWARLAADSGISGVGAYTDGRLAGIAHYLFHPHVWEGTVCYLQDLFVDETMRKRGIGQRLIEHVARLATDRGAFRLYWSTHRDNIAVRRMYDRVAALTPYMRYDMALPPTSTNLE
jgi:GNAT superfamily N-acetyltransferase